MSVTFTCHTPNVTCDPGLSSPVHRYSVAPFQSIAWLSLFWCFFNMFREVLHGPLNVWEDTLLNPGSNIQVLHWSAFIVKHVVGVCDRATIYKDRLTVWACMTWTFCSVCVITMILLISCSMLVKILCMMLSKWRQLLMGCKSNSMKISQDMGLVRALLHLFCGRAMSDQVVLMAEGDLCGAQRVVDDVSGCCQPSPVVFWSQQL